MREIKIKNPWFIKAITFFKNEDFSKEKVISYLKNKFKNKNSDSNEIIINKIFKLKYFLSYEIDYVTFEIWFLVNDDKNEFLNTHFVNSYLDLGIDFHSLIKNEDIICEKNYIIWANYFDLIFPEILANEIYFKKEGEYKYIYSKIENNEFIIEFLKHIIKFDTYFHKVLNFYKKFSKDYPKLQKSNLELIKDYSKILDSPSWKLSNLDLLKFTKKVNNLEWVNFWLMYDIESLTSNLENLISRIKIIWWENSRYFNNNIEKTKFIIETFESILKKNKLVKDNILENYINITKHSIENEKIQNEKNKINHIKNIKEIISWLAFIEIFINWISEMSEIFQITWKVWIILENTAFMRMVLIVFFIFFYFMFFFYKKITNKVN